MADSLMEAEVIDAADDEQAALRTVDRLLARAAAEGQTAPMLVSPGGTSVELPPSVSRLLRAVVHYLANGQAVTLVPIGKELTTQQAADLLNVSRPYLVKLLEQGVMPYTKTGTHRRIRAADVLSYKARRDAQRAEELDCLTHLSQEIGLYDA